MAPRSSCMFMATGWLLKYYTSERDVGHKVRGLLSLEVGGNRPVIINVIATVTTMVTFMLRSGASQTYLMWEISVVSWGNSKRATQDQACHTWTAHKHVQPANTMSQ